MSRNSITSNDQSNMAQRIEPSEFTGVSVAAMKLNFSKNKSGPIGPNTSSSNTFTKSSTIKDNPFIVREGSNSSKGLGRSSITKNDVPKYKSVTSKNELYNNNNTESKSDANQSTSTTSNPIRRTSVLDRYKPNTTSSSSSDNSNNNTGRSSFIRSSSIKLSPRLEARSSPRSPRSDSNKGRSSITVPNYTSYTNYATTTTSTTTSSGNTSKNSPRGSYRNANDFKSTSSRGLINTLMTRNSTSSVTGSNKNSQDHNKIIATDRNSIVDDSRYSITSATTVHSYDESPKSSPTISPKVLSDSRSSITTTTTTRNSILNSSTNTQNKTNSSTTVLMEEIDYNQKPVLRRASWIKSAKNTTTEISMKSEVGKVRVPSADKHDHHDMGHNNNNNNHATEPAVGSSQDNTSIEVIDEGIRKEVTQTYEITQESKKDPDSMSIESTSAERNDKNEMEDEVHMIKSESVDSTVQTQMSVDTATEHSSDKVEPVPLSPVNTHLPILSTGAAIATTTTTTSAASIKTTDNYMKDNDSSMDIVDTTAIQEEVVVVDEKDEYVLITSTATAAAAVVATTTTTTTTTSSEPTVHKSVPSIESADMSIESTIDVKPIQPIATTDVSSNSLELHVYQETTKSTEVAPEEKIYAPKSPNKTLKVHEKIAHVKDTPPVETQTKSSSTPAEVAAVSTPAVETRESISMEQELSSVSVNNLKKSLGNITIQKPGELPKKGYGKAVSPLREAEYSNTFHDEDSKNELKNDHIESNLSTASTITAVTIDISNNEDKPAATGVSGLKARLGAIPMFKPGDAPPKFNTTSTHSNQETYTSNDNENKDHTTNTSGISDDDTGPEIVKETSAVSVSNLKNKLGAGIPMMRPGDKMPKKLYGVSAIKYADEEDNSHISAPMYNFKQLSGNTTEGSGSIGDSSGGGVGSGSRSRSHTQNGNEDVQPGEVTVDALKNRAVIEKGTRKAPTRNRQFTTDSNADDDMDIATIEPTAKESS